MEIAFGLNLISLSGRDYLYYSSKILEETKQNIFIDS